MCADQGSPAILTQDSIESLSSFPPPSQPCDLEALKEFERARERGDVGTFPALDAFRTAPQRILQLFALILLPGAGFYMLFVWWPTVVVGEVWPVVRP